MNEYLDRSDNFFLFIGQSDSWISNYSTECFSTENIMCSVDCMCLLMGLSWKVILARLWLSAVFPEPPQMPLNMNEEGKRYARLCFSVRSFLIRNIEPECLARNKRRGSSIIHYHLPSIPYFGMLYDPRKFTPRNLSDGIGLRLTRERRNTILMDYDAALISYFRYFTLYIYIYNSYFY